MSAEVGDGAARRNAVEIFDTTLRDGAQLEGISLTVDDKLRIAEQLDHLGITWIEGGWPGANPKDEEFFRRAATELKLTTSTLVAFGSTRRVKGKVDDDPTLANLVAAGTSAVCIVGKSWDYHVTEALTTTLDEGVAMVADSVEYLRGHGLGVMFDAEHFFDGYKRNPEFALRVLEAAAEKGASTLVLCDTNGGSLPFEVEQIVGDVVSHFRNDVDRRDPHARRHRMCGRQRARGSAGGRPPGAGHDQRHRRAHRQLQPHDGHPEPHAEDGDRDDPARPAWSGSRRWRTTSPSSSTSRRTRRRPTSDRRRSRTRPACT